jgi:ATP/maltotriose-dependent transcriptional regulator MalT
MFAQGRLGAALQLLRLALPMIERHLPHSKRERAFVLRSLGEVEVATGDRAAGLAHLEASVPLFREMNKSYAAAQTQSLVESSQQQSSPYEAQQSRGEGGGNGLVAEPRDQANRVDACCVLA